MGNHRGVVCDHWVVAGHRSAHDLALGDAGLVAAARGGDREAFGVLLARHRLMVLGACLRLLGDRFLAEEAFQEAAITAMTNLDRLEHPERFGAWVTGIALNMGRRRLRQQARDVGLVAGQTEGLGPAGPAQAWADPAAIAERREVAAQVRRAVAGLPEGQRAAVVAYFLLGLTQREAAALLGTTPGAVKTRVHKATGTLRRQLSDVWEETAMPGPPAAVPVRLADVYALAGDGPPDHYVALLEEVEGGRRVPIWIGEAEATALALTLQGVELFRPGAYHTALRLLDAAGAQVVETRVTRLIEGTYYATVTIEGPQGLADVDVRPSDGLNLAQLADAAITLDPAVFTTLDAAAADGVPATADDLTGRITANSGQIMQRRKERIEALRAVLEGDGPADDD